ncbi:MAG: glycoside hydrolase family 27 protein [Chitinophagales bacterium]|nr:glycoside hydrolase family 27 protein [Chitinophagales bacterium]
MLSQPFINGPELIGCYPNSEWIYSIPVVAKGKKKFSSTNLPGKLQLDTANGIIRGVAPEAGRYLIPISVSDDFGSAVDTLTLICGNKLALTPPMGWNSWNVFAHEVNEKIIIEMADAMIASGMKDAGYQYINIDDFWQAAQRATDGTPLANPEKFPNGIKYLADYLHSKGLKLGLYSCAGKYTCGKRFGSFGYEEIDAKTYAAWGVDLLKYDYCYAPWARKKAIKRYRAMAEALQKTGRSIVFSVCEWGLRKPWKWASEIGGHYWRTTPDIFDKWKGNHIWRYSMMQILRKQRGLERYARPGGWNDPDMLLVGNYGKGIATSAKGRYKGMTDTEYESHFAIWCMLSAPLLASCDLRNMNEATRKILLNTKLISINQDVAGNQAVCISRKKGIWIYRKPLSKGIAYAFLNTRGSKKYFTIPYPIQKEINAQTEKILNAEQIQNITKPLALEGHQTMVIIAHP